MLADLACAHATDQTGQCACGPAAQPDIARDRVGHAAGQNRDGRRRLERACLEQSGEHLLDGAVAAVDHENADLLTRQFGQDLDRTAAAVDLDMHQIRHPVIARRRSSRPRRLRWLFGLLIRPIFSTAARPRCSLGVRRQAAARSARFPIVAAGFAARGPAGGGPFDAINLIPGAPLGPGVETRRRGHAPDRYPAPAALDHAIDRRVFVAVQNQICAPACDNLPEGRRIDEALAPRAGASKRRVMQ